VLGLAAAMAIPAVAARRVTIAQLAETVSSAVGQHRSDEDIARQLGTLELSERLTETNLHHFAARLALQPRTALALQMLADQSAFLDLPSDELPGTAPPDATAQQKMLEGARAYAVQTWSRLPNFFVARVTTSFDDGPQVMRKGEWPVRLGLHPIGTSNRQITFRDGQEVADQNEGDKAKSAAELGLRSWGEFGPALTVVLADMGRRPIAFTHWEQTDAGLAAVFRYEVPKEASHYAVSYCCTVNEQVLGRTQFGYGGRERSAQQVANIPRGNEAHTYTETPGYRGTIAIDPATGAVLRLTIDADLSKADPLLRAATAIEYGPVTIGDRKFICPLRSIAVSQEQAGAGAGTARAMELNGVGDTAWQSPLTRAHNAPILLINETRFAEYHRLGSTARILTDAGANDPASTQTVKAPAPGGGNTSAPPQASADAGAADVATQTVQQQGAQAAASPPPPEERVAPPPPAQPVIPEISMSTADSVPDLPANAPTGPNSGFSIKVTTRLVDVGIVAYDKKGRPVTDLKAEDFELYDNGRKQEIHFFTPAGGALATAPESALPATAVSSFSNRALEPISMPGSAPSPETGSTILLIDESHIAWGDLDNARNQMLKFLAVVAPSERVGLYSMTGLGFRVLAEPTRDHAALMALLKTFTPKQQALSNAQEEEKRNRQQFNEVHNAADLNSVNGNHTDVPDADQPVDPQLMTMGNNPARSSLIILSQVARHLAAIAGHKNLVWVSSDNVFGDWQDQQVGIDKSPKGFESYALRLQEAMNDAHAAVYPFDVSQLESSAVSADIQHRNVELTQAAADNAATAAAASGSGPTARDMQPGRISAEMSQDLHPIQGPIREVAAATGGRTIRRTGGLADALSGIVEDGRSTYLLSFSPQGPADDQYHSISVKLAGRRGLTLRYRTGYLFQKEPATLKDRFQQAMWRPRDMSEIAITAEIAPQTGSADIKVNVAASDLGMEEQAGRWMDKLDIFFIQRDDAGLHAHVEGQTLGLRLKPSTYQSLLPKGVPFERAIAMRAGMASLRVLVVDENSGRMGSVTIPSVAIRVNP
jgi:VWFA-related protein